MGTRGLGQIGTDSHSGLDEGAGPRCEKGGDSSPLDYLHQMGVVLQH